MDISCDLTFHGNCWSWQALGFGHGLSDQLKSIIHPLEEIGMVPISSKEIVIKCTFIHVKPPLRHIVYRLMLKIKFIDQKFILGRLAVPVAPQSLDFILGAFLKRIERFWIKAICPLSCRYSQEFFTCVKNLLVVHLDINF